MNLKKLFFSSETPPLTEKEKSFIAALRQIKDDFETPPTDEPIGDGGAVFISDATDEEFEEYEHNEKKGWGKFKQIIEVLRS